MLATSMSACRRIVPYTRGRAPPLALTTTRGSHTRLWHGQVNRDGLSSTDRVSDVPPRVY